MVVSLNQGHSLLDSPLVSGCYSLCSAQVTALLLLSLKELHHSLLFCLNPAHTFLLVHFSSVARCVQLFATPWTAARQASLPITNSRSLLKLKCIESVMPSNHLILCPPLLLLPSIFPSIRVFSNESVLHIKWPRVLEFQLQHQTFQ